MSDEQALATTQAIGAIETQGEFTVADVLAQVEKIQEIMHIVMRPQEHYGTIPGCGDKPTLLKSGAEKIGFTFRLVPRYDVERIDMPDDHREYEVTCNLYHMTTGRFVGSGVGACSTKEAKYRYRNENTGRAVPQDYWKNRDPALLGGAQFSPKKINKKWCIVHKVEHDNPSDYYNTVLKMAKKRAHVDAILTSTAASDIFTQDLDDLAQNGVLPTNDTDQNGGDQTDEPQRQEPQRKSEEPMSESAAKNLFKAIVQGKIGKKTVSADKLREYLAQVQDISHLEAIPDCARWLDQNAEIKNGAVRIKSADRVSEENAGNAGNELPSESEADQTPQNGYDPKRAELDSFCICCVAASVLPMTEDYKTYELKAVPDLEDPNDVSIALTTFKNKDGKVINGKSVADLSDKAVAIAIGKVRKLADDLVNVDQNG